MLYFINSVVNHKSARAEAQGGDEDFDGDVNKLGLIRPFEGTRVKLGSRRRGEHGHGRRLMPRSKSQSFTDSHALRVFRMSGAPAQDAFGSRMQRRKADNRRSGKD